MDQAFRDPADRPAWVDGIDNPYLHGIYAPVAGETTGFDLRVEGELPRDLYGAYVRNGPNPVFAPANPYHWFDGDGMVHGVYFEDGKASYRNRWVRTEGLAHEEKVGRSVWAGIMGPFDCAAPGHYLKDTANTDLIWHNGSLLALWYLAGAAYRLDPATLDGRGRETLGGELRTSVSAHPKVDERSGDLCYFTYGDVPPYMTNGVVSRRGELVHTIPIDLPGPRSPHDLTITERYTILHDFPYFHDPQLQARTKRRIARFHPELPSRFGVVPRFGGTDEVRWFEFAPGYVLHMVNAWEEGDWIVMDGCLQPDPTIRRRPEEGALGSMLAYFRARFHLHRWRMNVRTGEAKEEALDDLNVEFCLPDTRLYGTKTRYSYHQYIPPDAYTLVFEALVKYDHDGGKRVRYDYGPGKLGSEAPFAPRAGARGEDDGYVVTIVTDAADCCSQCWVFSARDIEQGPLAKVKLPARVPAGFHAKWLPGERVWGDEGDWRKG
jgi:carotenoid cleavage dioxygenase